MRVAAENRVDEAFSKPQELSQGKLETTAVLASMVVGAIFAPQVIAYGFDKTIGVLLRPHPKDSIEWTKIYCPRSYSLYKQGIFSLKSAVDSCLDHEADHFQNPSVKLFFERLSEDRPLLKWYFGAAVGFVAFATIKKVVQQVRQQLQGKRIRMLDR